MEGKEADNGTFLNKKTMQILQEIYETWQSKSIAFIFYFAKLHFSVSTKSAK